MINNYLGNTFQALGGGDEAEGFINKGQFKKILIDDFGLDINIDVRLSCHAQPVLVISERD